MERLSGFVLRHRLLVVLAWLALTLGGGSTVGMMQSRPALTVPLPSKPGFVASARIAALYHTGGPAAPAVIVVRLPPGLTAGLPAVRAELGQL